MIIREQVIQKKYDFGSSLGEAMKKLTAKGNKTGKVAGFDKLIMNSFLDFDFNLN